jgi:serine/threonine protein kinase
MDLASGNSLYDEVKKHMKVRFKESEVKNIILQLLEGLKYLYEKGIMH